VFPPLVLIQASSMCILCLCDKYQVSETIVIEAIPTQLKVLLASQDIVLLFLHVINVIFLLTITFAIAIIF